LKAFEGVVEIATESELANASAHADRDGLFTCPHTGVALAALTKLAKRGEIKRDDEVVVISTASGLKFADFKVGYHEARLEGVESPRFRNVPVELPERYEAVRDALQRGLDG
ncbi:MAG: threonine synthase, partial [Deltaproteobacteria bacterium]|nr:threonine synthase [Deltaproteobacteria bacterium]